MADADMLELMQDSKSNIWRMQSNHSMLSCENKTFDWMWSSMWILEAMSTYYLKSSQIGYLRTGSKDATISALWINVEWNGNDPDMRQWGCYCPWPLKRPLLFMPGVLLAMECRKGGPPIEVEGKGDISLEKMAQWMVLRSGTMNRKLLRKLWKIAPGKEIIPSTRLW